MNWNASLKSGGMVQSPLDIEAAGRLRRGLAIAALVLILGGCGGGGGGGPAPTPPAPPAAVSLEVAGVAEVEETGNPKVQVTARLDAPASGAVTVALSLAGTAERDRDYALDADTLSVAASATSATAEFDVYRDFEEEGDETIEVSLGAITGNARAGDPSSVTLTVIDGPAATLNKMPSGNGSDDGGGDGAVLEEIEFQLVPLGFDVTEEHVVMILSAQVAPGAPGPVPMVAELSTDPGFSSESNPIPT